MGIPKGRHSLPPGNREDDLAGRVVHTVQLAALENDRPVITGMV